MSHQERFKALLPVIRAFSEGKTIEHRCPHIEHSPWEVIENPDFGHPPECYRIKPDPREFWVRQCNQHQDVRFIISTTLIYECCDSCEVIHVKEVQ